MSQNNGMIPEDLLRIISSYAAGGAEFEKLAHLYEILSPLIPPLKEKEYIETNKRILSIISGKEEKTRNLTLDFENWLSGMDREFSLSQCYADLGITSKHEKDAVRKAIAKNKDTKIENIGQKSGQYRVINRNIEYTDYKNVVQISPIDLKLPLGLHKRTIFFPKSLCAIAGVTGTGKTSWALNIMLENQGSYKFKYFYNSELSPSALNKKLSYFNFPINEWQFEAIPSKCWDHTNIHKMVFPDCINVIDYLEPDPGKIWTIYNDMAAISENLNKGMAIILLQKKSGSDFGTGGDWSAKAASFYIALEYQKAKITKNTYREEDKIGYDKNNINWDIIPGAHIKASSGWYGEQSNKSAEKKKVFADVGIVDDRQHEDFPHEEDEE
jgi:hypothetical protein